MEITSVEMLSNFGEELFLAILVGVVTIGLSYLLIFSVNNKMGK